MREFTTALSRMTEEERQADAEKRIAARPKVETTHDGNPVVFLRPDDTQIAMMATVWAGFTGETEGMAHFLALFFECCDENTKRYFRHRLFDTSDPFDFYSEGGIMDLLGALLEEWTARPTKRPSDFTPPQDGTGRPSTAKQRSRASRASSGSPRTGSATRSTSGSAAE